jgi:CheY-like chemotaxis protein
LQWQEKTAAAFHNNPLRFSQSSPISSDTQYMTAVGGSEKRFRAREISATLAGLRFGLCGYDTGEARRISRALAEAGAVTIIFDERLLADSAQLCDGIIVNLAGASSIGLQLAASSGVPVLVTASSQALVQGVGNAYRWPRELITEPWTEAELLVRLFRLIAVTGEKRAVEPASEREPLVVLIDDNPELAALVEATLQSTGIQCRTAQDGLSGLQTARELIPDCILLDIKMPGMDGFEVLETMRCDPGLQAIPVIMLTGCDDSADIIRCAELAAGDYLAKPVSPNLLLERVKRLLAARPRYGGPGPSRSPASSSASRPRAGLAGVNASPRPYPQSES